MDIQMIADQVNEHAAYGQRMSAVGEAMMSTERNGRHAYAALEGDVLRITVRNADGEIEWTYEADAADAHDVDMWWGEAVTLAHAERCECGAPAEETVTVPGRGPVPMCERHAFDAPIYPCARCSAPVVEEGDLCDECRVIERVTGAEGCGDVKVRATLAPAGDVIVVRATISDHGPRWAEPRAEMVRDMVDTLAARAGVARTGRRTTERHADGWEYAYPVA